MAMAMAGCAPTPPERAPTLSLVDKAANAEPLAELIHRACIATAKHPDALGDILTETGWPHRQVQDGTQPGELDVWDLPKLKLVVGSGPLASPDADTWICSLSIDPTVAPSPEQMEKALRMSMSRSILESKKGDWRWKPSLLTEAHITVGPGGEKPDGLLVFAEYADLNALRAIFGS